MTRFASAFDERLAETGPAALFLRDREGMWRFDPQWTRDAWGRVGEPPRTPPVWSLVRDRASGFHWLVLATGDLLTAHPRLDVRHVGDEVDGLAQIAALGPVAVGPWSR